MRPRTTRTKAGSTVHAIHSNTVENAFSVFTGGMKGIYQHCGEAHLPRYLTEFEFR